MSLNFWICECGCENSTGASCCQNCGKDNPGYNSSEDEGSLERRAIEGAEKMSRIKEKKKVTLSLRL